MLSHPLSNPAISHPSFRIRDLLNLVRLIACFLRRLGNSVLLLSESAIYSISRDSVLLFLLINLAGLAFYGAASSAQSRVTRSFTALLLLLNLARLAILRRCFFFDFLVGVSCSEGELENFLKNSFLGTPAKWSRVTCFGHNLLFAPSLLRIRLVIEKAWEDITMYDKSWIHIRRTEKSYLDGVEKFIRVAGIHSKCPGMIVCPCSKCINSGYKETDTVRDHLVIYGISENYAKRDYWIAHGEIDPSQRASTLRPNFPNVVIEPHDGISRPYEVYDDIEVQLGEEMSRIAKSTKNYKHALGRTSLANVKHNMAQERVADGDYTPPNTSDVWIYSRTREDKDNPSGPRVPVDDRARETIEKLYKARRDHPAKNPMTIVFGPEHPGRVRGASFGVTPSLKFYAHSEKSMQDLKKENQVMKDRQENLEADMQFVLQQLGVAQSRGTPSQPLVVSSVLDTSGVRISGTHPSGGQPSALGSRPPLRPIQEHLHGKLCYLDPEIPLKFRTIVAEAKLENTDPAGVVSDVLIGNHCYSVEVLSVFKDWCEIPYPTGDTLYIGHCRRTVIKWPIKYISFSP